jgi:hypothetical protein
MSLREKLREKLETSRQRRTGAALRSAKRTVGSKEKVQLMKDIRKKGVKALTKTLGIQDPELEKHIALLIKTGDAKDANDLLAKIQDYQNRKKRESEVAKMKEENQAIRVVEQQEFTPVPSLVSASNKRTSLKRMSEQFRGSQEPANAFEEWLQGP